MPNAINCTQATLAGIVLAGSTLTATWAVESEQYLKGELLVEALNQDNYTDGNGDTNDHSNQMWLRAKFGAKVELQERVEAQVTLVYDAEGGDASGRDTTKNEVEIHDAYVLLKHFLREDTYLRLGRQPGTFNLRTDHGAFLLDSRAHTGPDQPRPTVTSWDGLTGWYESETFKIIPYYYILDEVNEANGTQLPTGKASRSNDIFGISLDYKPHRDNDTRNIFATFSWTLERNPLLDDGTVLYGEELTTWYAGATMSLPRGFDIYLEGASQDGDYNGNVDFGGYGISTGVTWSPPGDRSAVIGFQYDLMSGDDDASDGKYKSFVNTWEGVSDTLIVEHERYGELSELMVGNLQAMKLKAEWGFSDNRIATKFIAAWYKLDEGNGGSDDFGREFDFEIDFQYNDYTSFSIFAGAFLPGDGYRNVAAARTASPVQDDEAFIFGFNTRVLF